MSQSEPHVNATGTQLEGVRVKVTLRGKVSEFRMGRESTVLAAALEQGLDPPFHCEKGGCTACLAKIEVGRVVMKQNEILSEDDVNRGLILTCQSVPQVDEIEINYDVQY